MPAAPGFLEIFAGKAGLTQAAKRHGVAVLPPIELLPNEVVLEAVDILQPEVLQHVKALLTGHHVQMVHFGTPCSSFSQARKLDGGPPPLRDRDHLYGLAGLAADDQKALRLGTQLMEVTAQLVTSAQQAGVKWSIENPETSLLWDMPPVQTLASFPTVQKFGLDMCRFGSPHMKPTTLLANYDLAAVALRCDRAQRPHEHEPLIGKVQVDGRWVYKTRLAQVYPPALCQQWAAVMDRSRPDLLAATFAMVTPDRKRPLGQAMPWRPHRQHATADYQLKRSAMPPLLGEEMEPGRAVQVALGLDHPFTADPALPPDLQEALALTFFHAEAITSMRAAQLVFWAQRAALLLPETDTTLRQVADPALRRLLRGVPDDQPLELGKVTHIALWRELLREACCIDRQLTDEMLHGFSIIGPISRSFRWQALTSQPQLTETELHERAWEFSEKVMRNVQRSEITEFWEATMEDVQEKVTVGPFYHMSEVSQYLGTDRWVPTQRFEVVQKNKVRGVDSATANRVNTATEITEKLDLPSTDLNVAVLRWIKTHLPPGQKAEGWVLDERKAYRQIAVRPAHRRWSVIALKDAADGRVAFFVMIGHSFGLVAAVYSYNRRSAAITDILRRVFHVAAFNFYDDKYGFESDRTCRSAFRVTQEVHRWLGAGFDLKKLQQCCDPTILGVTHDLAEFRLMIKASRKEEILSEIDAILSSGSCRQARRGSCVVSSCLGRLSSGGRWGARSCVPCRRGSTPSSRGVRSRRRSPRP